jgi:hypothetical protein
MTQFHVGQRVEHVEFGDAEVVGIDKRLNFDLIVIKPDNSPKRVSVKPAELVTIR